MSDVKKNLIFLEIFSENALILNLMRILLVDAELFHADGETDVHKETNGRFSKFYEGA